MYQYHATFENIIAVLKTFISYSCKLELVNTSSLTAPCYSYIIEGFPKLVWLIVKFSLGIGFWPLLEFQTRFYINKLLISTNSVQEANVIIITYLNRVFFALTISNLYLYLHRLHWRVSWGYVWVYFNPWLWHTAIYYFKMLDSENLKFDDCGRHRICFPSETRSLFLIERLAFRPCVCLLVSRLRSISNALADYHDFGMNIPYF